jgi:transcriptional regulator with XRE-family HTH domain
MLSKFIYQMRKKNNLTQELLANKLGVSRPTYCQIEKGERDITVDEAKKLADIFGIKFNDFLEGKENEIIVKLEKEKKDLKEEKIEMRISVPHLKKEKFKEVFIYILTKVGGKPNIGETAIYKLLYFIDFDYYEKYEEQLIGATYIKNHFGPTPVEFKKIVDEMVENNEVKKVNIKYFNYDQKKYLALREPDLSKLKDARELQHIDEVLARLSDKNGNELSNYSHDDVP